MNTSPYVVAIEIGSSVIKGAAGQIDSSGTLTVRAIEEEHQHPNYVRYGCVHNVKEVANELKRIIVKLNNSISPEKISAVYLGVGGRSLKSTSARLNLTLSENTEVTPEIVERLLGSARIADSDHELLDVESMEFSVDGKPSGADPVGLLGHDISATVNIVSCRSQMLRNLQLVIGEKLELKVNGYVVRPLALADMVLTSEERRLGSMLVDCGAETTTVAVFKSGVLHYLATIPLGSRHITRDITMALPYLEERAEELKRAVGNARPSEGHHVPSIEESDTSQINNIISARASEIIANINAQVEYAGMKAGDLAGGIVLVGGGSMLQGFAEELSKVTTLGVRRGSLPPTVRIAGSKISTGEDLDVIAVLYRLSREEHLKPCASLPAERRAEQQGAATAAASVSDEEEFGYGDESDESDEDDLTIKHRQGNIISRLFERFKSGVVPPTDLGEFDEE